MQLRCCVMLACRLPAAASAILQLCTVCLKNWQKQQDQARWVHGAAGAISTATKVFRVVSGGLELLDESAAFYLYECEYV